MTAATDAPGGERRIADGTAPTWGGGPDQTGNPPGGTNTGGGATFAGVRLQGTGLT